MESRDFRSRVLYEKDGAIARVIMNWPEKANSQDSEMVWALDEALKEADKDYDAKVVIIKANGKGFCAGHMIGGDLGEHMPEFAEDMAVTGMAYKGAAELFLWPVLNLWEFSKPTIAQVHGYALGAGSYWAFLPDITVASDDAYFQMPLPQAMGLPTGETMMEPWLFMNWKRTAWYLYQSKTITAQQAYEWGAVNEVVPRDQLEETVEQIARNIAQAPGSTLRMTKALIKRAWELMGLRVHWQMSNDLMALASKARDVEAHVAQMRDSQRKPREMVAHHQAQAQRKNQDIGTPEE